MKSLLTTSAVAALGIALAAEALQAMLDPSRFVGRAPAQVVKFLDRDVQPILDANADLLGRDASLRV